VRRTSLHLLKLSGLHLEIFSLLLQIGWVCIDLYEALRGTAEPAIHSYSCLLVIFGVSCSFKLDMSDQTQRIRGSWL